MTFTVTLWALIIGISVVAAFFTILDIISFSNARGAIIEIVPSSSVLSDTSRNVVFKFSLQFTNGSNATSTEAISGSMAFDLIALTNAILEGKTMEQLAEEAVAALEEEREESSSSSNSDTSGEFVPGPGDTDTFPENMEPVPFPPQDKSPDNDQEGEDNSNSDSEGNGSDSESE